MKKETSQKKDPKLERRIIVAKNKKRGKFGLFMDFVLTFCTGGAWLVWIFIRFLRNNS